jgi:hypothetical protein
MIVSAARNTTMRIVCLSVAVGFAVLEVSRVDASARVGQLFNRAIEFQRYQDAARHLSLDYPKGWQIVSGAGSVIVTFAQKKSEATVAIEYEALDEPLQNADITEVSMNLEVKRLKLQTPQAENFKPTIVDEKGGRRLVVVDFTRPAVTAGVDRAREYSFVSGKERYRMTCSAGKTLFDKYVPVFEHMVASFKTVPAAVQGASH